MGDLDGLLCAIEWTSQYVPLKIPHGLEAKLAFARGLALDLATGESEPEPPKGGPVSSPVARLLEGPPGWQ
jgi:hypothetical protein